MSTSGSTYVDFVDAGARSQRLAVACDVIRSGEVIASLQPTGGSVTLDATAEIRSRAELSFTGLDLVPDSVVALLAPYGNELRLARGLAYPDHTELVQLGIFRIEDATISEDDGAISISVTGLDRAARFVDHPFEEAGQIAVGTLVTDAIIQVLQPTTTFEWDFNTSSSEATPLITYSQGDSRWAMAQGLGTIIHCDLYFGRDGRLKLEPIPSIAPGAPVAALQEGEDGVLLDLARTMSRTEVYNRVIVSGQPLEGATTVPRGVATDDNPNSPTYFTGPFGPKVYFYEATGVTNNTQAASTAAGILARTLGAPDAVSLGAVVDPARNPGDIVRITRRKLGVDEDHILDSVTIPLDAESAMTADTRVTQLLST